jgi:hypothetical protein
VTQVNQAGLDISALSAGLSATQTSLDGKVSKASIIASINASGESGVKISADKLTFSGLATFTEAQSLANTAQTNAINNVKSGLGTLGYTIINGGNISTTNLTFSGGIQGSKFGINSGFSITTNGYINLPSTAPINFGSDLTMINRTNDNILHIYNQVGMIDITSSSYTQISGLYAKNQPYNIPMTTTAASTKVTEIAHFSTYFNVSCNGTNYGITYTVSDEKFKTKGI